MNFQEKYITVFKELLFVYGHVHVFMYALINFVCVCMCVSVHVHVYVHYLCVLGIELWSSESIENSLSDYIISSAPKS